MTRPPRGIARFDSAAAMVQALAASLRGKAFSSLSQSPWLDAAMPAINRLPRTGREWAYAIGGMSEGITARAARRLDIERIAQWITDAYPTRPYRAAFIGSSNGALVHLAAAMGVPWLPQTFLCPVRAAPSDPDDARQGFEAGRRIVDSLLEADPRIAVHQMQDPNQDRLMLRTMRYFRLKHRALPLAHREFLLRSLAPGGTLFVIECTRSWPVTRTGDRSLYQFGATGGATEDEYLRGGPRVREYLARYGCTRHRWEPPEPNDVAPEAEWGFDAALHDDIVELAQQMNWRVVEIRFRSPESMSFAAAAIYRTWYRSLGIEATRLVVDSFILMDPFTTLRLRAIPLWLLFCVEPSARALERFLSGTAPFDEIDLMLFSHGTESIGLASIARWRALLDRAARAGRFVGVDTARYPLDFATFARFARALAQARPLHDPPPLLAPADFEALMHRHGRVFGIECTELAAQSQKQFPSGGSHR
ncbi:hypothetical protein [Paraburkholderia sp. NMBU_R16]|uniref:hypothetical protein n=1 Tax=Paraburkholderia sp. NMBU_R16 TaxID=2698676 RepID=UPI001C27FED2|nr:hypothetical protein [Paraburkholderia sp. NMBU_R16]